MATDKDVAKVLIEMEKYEKERQSPRHFTPSHTPRPSSRLRKEIFEERELPSPNVIDRMMLNDVARVSENARSMFMPTRVPLNKPGPKFGFERPAEKIRLPSEGIFLCKGGQVKQLSGPLPRQAKPKIELPQVKFGRKIG